MSINHPLDNPIWHALVGPHAPLAVMQGAARHYRFDVAPFSAIVEPTPEAYGDLAVDLLPRSEVRLFRPTEEATPPGWETISMRPMFQMLLDDEGALGSQTRADEEVIPLLAEDIDAMLELADMAKPGPFSHGRLLLGEHVGVKREGRLVAMAGPRLRLPGFGELSAICVHPDVRRASLGSALTRRLARRILTEGDVPFLHVFIDNPAITLYQKLGFRVRKKMWVIWRRPINYSTI